MTSSDSDSDRTLFYILENKSQIYVIDSTLQDEIIFIL